MVCPPVTGQPVTGHSSPGTSQLHQAPVNQTPGDKALVNQAPINQAMYFLVINHRSSGQRTPRHWVTSHLIPSTNCCVPVTCHKSLVLIRSYHAMTGLGGSVGCAIRLETRRSWVQPPPRSATFFHAD